MKRMLSLILFTGFAFCLSHVYGGQMDGISYKNWLEYHDGLKKDPSLTKSPQKNQFCKRLNP